MKKGQIWVETVLYTVIIISIITLILALTIQSINKQKDEAIVAQSIDALNTMDQKIKDVSHDTGNVRIVDFNLRKGKLFISGKNDTITLMINDLGDPYSQPDIELNEGNVKILTTQGPKKSSVNLTLKYNFNMTYDGNDEEVAFSQASTAYKFSIENSKTIDIREVSQG